MNKIKLDAEHHDQLNDKLNEILASSGKLENGSKAHIESFKISFPVPARKVTNCSYNPITGEYECD